MRRDFVCTGLGMAMAGAVVGNVVAVLENLEYLLLLPRAALRACTNASNGNGGDGKGIGHGRSSSVGNRTVGCGRSLSVGDRTVSCGRSLGSNGIVLWR